MPITFQTGVARFRDANGNEVDFNALGMGGGSGGSSIDYLGKVETDTEVMRLTLTIPDGYTEFWIRECHYPNSASATGWVRLLFNESYVIQLNSGVDGTNSANKEVYSLSHVKFEQGIILEELAWLSQNSSSVNRALRTSSGLLDYAHELKIDAVTKIQVSGYQAGVLGIGSYFEVWGAK